MAVLRLSAGEPLSTDVLVHENATVDGRKISKSPGTGAGLVHDYGPDALRWWLLREVNPAGDTDFRVERLVQRHDQDLANGLGNLVTRVRTLLVRYGQLPGLDAAASRPIWRFCAGRSKPPRWPYRSSGWPYGPATRAGPTRIPRGLPRIDEVGYIPL